MTLLILQIMLAILGLGTTIFVWWTKRQDSIIQKKNDEDKKIDSVSNADDTIVEFDRLHNEPPANRS